MRKATTRATLTVAALAAFGLAALVFAGAQARLKGKVTDSSGKPIEGATVTITTPNLRTFKMLLKSDKKGDWGTILNDATMPYHVKICLLYTSPSPRDRQKSRMPSSA